VNSLEACRDVLQTNIDSFGKPAFFHTLAGEFLGVGLLFSVGDQHKRLRRIITGQSGLFPVRAYADFVIRTLDKAKYKKTVSNICDLLS
jgi:hypothetical protein